MGKILEDVRTASEWIATALRSSGYHADFSPSSLWELDRFFDEQSRDGKPVPRGLLSKDLGSRIFALGSYLGEVIRRHAGGEWHGDDSDAKAEISVELRLHDGTSCWPVQRVMKRFKNGAEDGIALYGHALNLPIGEPSSVSAVTKKPWWKS